MGLFRLSLSVPIVTAVNGSKALNPAIPKPAHQQIVAELAKICRGQGQLQGELRTPPETKRRSKIPVQIKDIHETLARAGDSTVR